MRRSRFPRKWSCKLFFAREREKGDDLVDFLGTTRRDPALNRAPLNTEFACDLANSPFVAAIRIRGRNLRRLLLFLRKTDPTSNLLGALKVSQLFTHEVFPDPPKLSLGRGAVKDHGWDHWLPHRRRRCRPPPTPPSRVLELPAMSGMLRKSRALVPRY